jgi:hypothetical protein
MTSHTRTKVVLAVAGGTRVEWPTEQIEAELEASFDEKERLHIAQSRSVSFLSLVVFAWGQRGTSDLQETFIS